jgi:DNA-binding CsgD family transcriptional regulator
VDERAPGIVGRERELASLRAFLAAAGGERGLLLVGEAGIGKTALLEAAVAGWPGRVLASSGGLAALVAGAPLDGLAEPQRRALEAVGEGREAEPHAVRLALLNALRGLATEAPLLLAVDDLQWLDASSDAALAFAARRLEDAPVRLLLARRPGPPTELEAALVRPGLERLLVGPLSMPVLRRLVPGAGAAAGGNPRLARALADGDEALVAATLEALIGRPLAQVPAAAARLLLATSVSGELPAAEAEALAGADALDEAVESGVVRVDHGRLRPAHPLLGARARAAAGAREIRAALGPDEPDAALAERLSALAAAALARGDDVDAADLARLAVLLGDPPGARLLAGLTSPDEALRQDPDHAWALALAALAGVAAVEAIPLAEARAERALEAAIDDAELAPVARRALALARALRGRPIAGPADVLALQVGWRGEGPRADDDEPAAAGWADLEARHARGLSALRRQEPAEAVDELRAVWQRCTRDGVDEPGAFPVAPDLVDALFATDRRGEAGEVSARLSALAVEQSHPWATIAAARCAALLDLDPDALEEAAAGFARLGRPYDQARTLLALGSALRGVRRWGAARAALERAAATFDELGEDGWATLARSQLQRIGARRPHARGELTPAERRVVELAAAGRSNKEIAAQLVVTVNTVEVHLSRAYAKLGVRSRAQLAARLG